MAMVFAATAKDVAEIAGAVATVIGAAFGLWGAYVGANAVRAKTTPTRTPRRKAPRPAKTAPKAETSRDMTSEVEGYIVRFLIFYLVLGTWNAFLTVVNNPFVYFGGYFFDLARGLVYILIFLMLGLPLLLDIYRRYGIRGRPRDDRH